MLVTQIDPLVPYRSSVQERLASCEDYLGRHRRSLAGEIAPDRHYFAEKAHELRDAARSLLDHVDDIEWWLGACREQLVVGPDDRASMADFGRAAGHPGTHREEERCPEHRVLAEVRTVSRSLRRLTDRLAWDLLTLRAGAGLTDPRSLVCELRQIQRQLDTAASSVATVATDAPGGDKEGR